MDPRQKVYFDSIAKGKSRKEAIDIAEAHHRTQQNLAAKPRQDYLRESSNFVDKLGAGAQAFSDASTFGLSGLVDDALSAGSFAENRAFRKQNKEALPGAVRFGAEVAGSVATPLGALKGAIAAVRGAKNLSNVRATVNAVGGGGGLVDQARRTASWGQRTARTLGDAAAQGALTGTTENIDDTSLSGLGSAVKAGATAGALSAGFTGAASGLAGGAARARQRAKGVKRLDQQALDLDKAIDRDVDAKYAVPDNEATTTPPISRLLNDDPIIAPYAREHRFTEGYGKRKLDDAQTVMAVYRRLSEREGGIRRAKDAGEKLTAGELDELTQIKDAKKHILAAVGEVTHMTTLGRARTFTPVTEAPSHMNSPQPKGRTVRDEIARMQEARAAAVRGRAPAMENKNPFAGKVPPSRDVVTDWRYAAMNREAMGLRESHLSRTAGSGTPQYVDGGRVRGARPESPYSDRAAEPYLDFPDDVPVKVRRGDVPDHAKPPQTRQRLEGETAQQRRARESMEYGEAEEEAATLRSEAPPERREVTRESREVVVGPGIPSLKAAIDTKRTLERERRAWERASDMARGIGGGRVLKGDKHLAQGQAKYLDEIPKMTRREMELALAAFHGRTREAVRLSNNPIGAFGVVSSTARLPLTSLRTGNAVRQLEERLGLGKRGQRTADATRSVLARMLGMGFTPEEER